jgi:hypothetical protein
MELFWLLIELRLRNIIAPKNLRIPVYDIGMGFKIRMCKNKRGDIRAWKTACPLLSGVQGKDFVIKLNLFPPKGGESTEHIL